MNDEAGIFLIENNPLIGEFNEYVDNLFISHKHSISEKAKANKIKNRRTKNKTAKSSRKNNRRK